MSNSDYVSEEEQIEIDRWKNKEEVMMPNRNTLHPNHLTKFCNWLELNDYLWRDSDADFQVIQVFVEEKWVPIYQRLRTDHFTIQAPLMPIVNKFIREVINGDKDTQH